VSYREQDGQVVLTLSKEDYNHLLFLLGGATGMAMRDGVRIDSILKLMNRLNEGNPHYTPYQVETK
jgi:hypothetical protein